MSSTREFNALKIANRAQIAENNKLIAERDSLKEQLQKALCERNRNYELVQITLKEKEKAESDKSEAVRIAVSQVILECNLCGFRDHDICKHCEQFKNKSDLERITGKKWEGLRG